MKFTIVVSQPMEGEVVYDLTATVEVEAGSWAEALAECRRMVDDGELQTQFSYNTDVEIIRSEQRSGPVFGVYKTGDPALDSCLEDIMLEAHGEVDYEEES